MLTTIEKVLFFRDAPLLAGVPTHALAHLAALAEERLLDGGDALWRPGDHADAVYFVVDGVVTVHGGGPILAAGPRCDLGATALLREGSIRDTTAAAIRAARVLRVSRDDFFDVLGEHPESARALIEALGRRLTDARRLEAGVLEPAR